MAHAPELPSGALQSIARQIGSRLTPSGFAAASRGATVAVAESFPVYMLGLDAVAKKPQSMKEAVRETGVWQHQIRHGSTAQEIARSTAPGAPAGAKDDWKVQEVVASPAAARIDEAIAWIDANAPEDSVANMLVVPAFYLTAFWLQNPKGDEVVIADMPAGLQKLAFHHRYPAGEFLGLLGQIRPLGAPTGSAPPPGGALAR